MNQIHEAKNLTCLHCKIPFPKTFTMGKTDGKIRKNQIMLCSNCGGAMILGDFDWRPFTRQDFELLPPASKRALVIAAAGIKSKLGAGKDWSPYDPPPSLGRN